jgi:hypothetical protein
LFILVLLTFLAWLFQDKGELLYSPRGRCHTLIKFLCASWYLQNYWRELVENSRDYFIILALLNIDVMLSIWVLRKIPQCKRECSVSFIQGFFRRLLSYVRTFLKFYFVLICITVIVHHTCTFHRFIYWIDFIWQSI